MPELSENIILEDGMVSESSDLSTDYSETSELVADDVSLVQVVQDQTDVLEEQLAYLDYINSGVIVCIILLCIVLGTTLIRFFFDRVRV